MKGYMGISGEMVHDAAHCVLDKSGNIIFAGMWERVCGFKHAGWIDFNYQEAFVKKFAEYKPSGNRMWKEERRFFNSPHKSLRLTEIETTDWRAIPNPGVPWHQLFPLARDPKDWTDIPHHLTHAVAAFATRPKNFDREDCVMVAIDGLGEWRSAAVFDNKFEVKHQLGYLDSIGDMYGSLTRMLGYEFGEDYLVMGLSCYGEPVAFDQILEIWDSIPTWVLEDPEPWKDYNHEKKIAIKDEYIARIIGPLLELKREDAAASLQKLTEHNIYKIMVEARKYGSKLCYSGGCAQNIIANTKIRDLFDDVWIDVNPSDGGCAIGSAAWMYMQDTGKDRINWEHPFLGDNIEGKLDPEMVVRDLLKHKITGVANGKAEFSPRAYGNRSLLADVRYDVKDTVNTIKQRQKFRPFAPAILEEHADEYFEGHVNEWMQYTALAKHDYTSVTHIDGTARVQLVPKDSTTVLRKILECYYDRTGVPMLLNTSLNIRGKPMVDNLDQAMQFEHRYGVKVFTS
jgi:carbamoyltransferase